MGDKSTAKATIETAGVPTVPGSNGVLTSVEEGIRLANEIGFPILLKATAGGGGKGIKLIDRPETFQQKWIEASQEAIASFGKEGLYLEKYIEAPRHIEIQIVADQYGRVIHLYERDCSITVITVYHRKHQKLVEESPSLL